MFAVEFGWNHDRTRPFYEGECGLFVYKNIFKSDEEDNSSICISFPENGAMAESLEEIC